MTCHQCKREIPPDSQTCGHCGTVNSAVEQTSPDLTAVQADAGARSAAGLAPDPAPATPQRIGDYRVVALLGTGGMSRVYTVEQASPKRLIALKVLTKGRLASETERLRFRREAAVVALLNHPYIVPIFEFGETANGESFYTMPLVDGEPLDNYVKNHALDRRQIVQLFIQVCSGVEAAHLRGAIHRDLKPGNVLVTSEGRPQVLDFGLAKIITEEAEERMSASSAGRREEASLEVSHANECLGTPAYMAPEQTSANPHAVDARADIYAIGVMLYRAVTGRAPFKMSGSLIEVLITIQNCPVVAPRTFMRELPADLEAIMLKALAKDRGARYQSAASLATDLQAFLENRPVSAVPDSVRYRFARLIGRHRAASLLSLVAVVALTIVIATAFVQIRRERDEAQTERDRAQAAEQTATAERLLAEQRLSDSLVAQGEAEALLLNWGAAKAKFQQVITQATALPATRLAAQLGLWHATRAAPPPVLVLAAHQSAVLGAAVTPDGRTLVTAGADATVTVWDLPVGRRRHVLQGHAAPVFCIAVTADGSRAVSGDWNGRLICWDLASGKPIDQKQVSKLPVNDLTLLAPDATAIAGSEEGGLTCWQPAGEVTTLPARGEGISALTATADRLYIGTADGMLAATDHLGHELWQVTAHDDSVLDVVTAADCVWTVAGAQIRAWHAADGRLLAERDLELANNAEIKALGLSGERLVAIGSDGSMTIFDNDGAPHRASAIAQLLNAAVARAAEIAFVCCSDGQVQVHGLAGGPMSAAGCGCRAPPSKPSRSRPLTASPPRPQSRTSSSGTWRPVSC